MQIFGWFSKADRLTLEKRGDAALGLVLDGTVLVGTAAAEGGELAAKFAGRRIARVDNVDVTDGAAIERSLRGVKDGGSVTLYFSPPSECKRSAPLLQQKSRSLRRQDAEPLVPIMPPLDDLCSSPATDGGLRTDKSAALSPPANASFGSASHGSGSQQQGRLRTPRTRESDSPTPGTRAGTGFHRKLSQAFFPKKQQQQAGGGLSPRSLSPRLAPGGAFRSGSPSSVGGVRSPAAGGRAGEPPSPSLQAEAAKRNAFREALQGPLVEVGNTRDGGLRRLCWNGIPDEYRARCWRHLVGCSPAAAKRGEYQKLLENYWQHNRHNEQMLRQITLDVERMQPLVKLFRHPVVQKTCLRVLYLWGIRHPASGYVQGMDALVTPFIAVFFSEATGVDLLATEDEDYHLSRLTNEDLIDLESDCFFALTALLANVQDYYTEYQPGLQHAAQKVAGLVEKMDPPLYDHVTGIGADFLRDFMWRWATCLLVRELPLHLAKRLWDTYLSEGAECNDFHVFVCIVFLTHWREELVNKEFPELMSFVRALPTKDLSEKDVDSWIAQAYVLQRTYEYTPS
ncbi:GTPase-activating protein gyp1 [Diplonema papillatum]|nr:GTPase-activating protein gyp1 [Diplonema papillatum]